MLGKQIIVNFARRSAAILFISLPSIWLTITLDVCAAAALPEVVGYSYTDLKECTENLFSFRGEILSAIRSRSGTELLLSCRNEMAGATMILGPGKDAAIAGGPGKICYPNDRGTVIAWSDDIKQEIRLANGKPMPRAKYTRFYLDSSGEYFAFETPGQGNCWLGSIEHPEASELVSTNWFPVRLFHRKNQLLVAGIRPDFGATRSVPILAFVKTSGRGFVIAKQIDCPGSVIDITEDGQWALAKILSDVRAEWLVVHLSSGRIEKTLPATTFGFFMKTNVLASFRP